MTSHGVRIGSASPECSLFELMAGTGGRPRLLVFVHGWSLAWEDDHEVGTIRARLRELDAELVVLSDGGVWAFGAGEESARYSARLTAEIAAAAQLYGVGRSGEAVFVIDGRGVVRFAHTPDRPLAASIVEALEAAAEALRARERHSKLERVLFTRREWQLTALVVGCALAFLGGCTTMAPLLPVAKRALVRAAELGRDARLAVVDAMVARLDSRRRLARGSVAPPAIGSRAATTPCAPRGALAAPAAAGTRVAGRFAGRWLPLVPSKRPRSPSGDS